MKRSIRFVSSCHSPSRVFYVGATFTRASAKTRACREPTKVEPAIDWLRALRSLPKESGSQTVERFTSRSASQSSLPLIRQEAPIDSKISVIVAALTLASTMAGVYVRLSVLTSRFGQYVPTFSPLTNYGHLFSVHSNLHDLTSISRLDY